MQLRKNISTPDRFVEEILVTKPRSATKPAHPTLMASQVVAFDPDKPPAAFPSLPLNSPTISSDVSLEDQESVSQPNDSRTNSWRPYRRSAYVWRDLQIISAPVDYEALGILPTPEQKEVHARFGSLNLMKADGEQARSRDLWLSLPLSLQYHIYKHLSLSKSDRMILHILGLSDKGFEGLLAAVALRDETPASVTDIWNSCANSNPVCEGSMVTDQMDIDSDVFHQNLGAMAFASKYETAYESEILRAKLFLESRSIPITILGTWVPDSTGSEGTEYFRHLPKNVAQLVGIDIAATGIVSGEVLGRLKPGQISKPSLSRTQDFNDIDMTRESTKSQTSHALAIQESRPTISEPTPKRGRHPLATVTLAGGSFSPPLPRPGDMQHHDEHPKFTSPRTMSQDYSQDHGDERMSGVMRLRNRSSIPATREAAPLLLDSDRQSCGSSYDESESAALGSELSTDTTSQSPNAGYLTLKIKKKDELAKIFHDQPQSSNVFTFESSGSRHTTPLQSTLGDGRDHGKLVTLRYSPEKFKLMHAGREFQRTNKLVTDLSKEDLAACGQENYTELSSRFKAAFSYGAQSLSMKRKASIADISTEPAKRRQLASIEDHPASIKHHDSHGASIDVSYDADVRTMDVSEQQFRPSAASSKMIAQSIETEDTILPNNMNNRELLPVLPKPQQNGPRSKAFDRAPSFSPIPENEHLEDFQALLKVQTPSTNSGSRRMMQEPLTTPQIGTLEEHKMVS